MRAAQVEDAQHGSGMATAREGNAQGKNCQLIQAHSDRDPKRCDPQDKGG